MSKFEVPQIPPQVLLSWPKEAQEFIATLQTLLEKQQALLTDQQAQINELTARLNQNSQNSDKPPSQDPPWQRPPKKEADPNKKPKGGQVGHSRHVRQLVPLEQVDEVVEVRPTLCVNPRCAAPLRASDQVGQPLRHQVWELPPSKSHLTEYQLYCYECSQCQTKNQAPLPPEVPTGQFGPRLVATVGLLHGQYQLSLRQTSQIAFDLWELPLSLGGVSDCSWKVAQALKTGYSEVQTSVQSSPTSHVDETSWQTNSKLTWLWVAVSVGATLFRVARSRCGKSLKALLGENYGGIVHSDRHKPYLKLDPSRHQLCWAHLNRNLLGLGQRASPAKEWAAQCLELSRQLFSLWHQSLASEGAISRASLIEQVEPIRAAFKAQLEKGKKVADGKVRAFSKQLLKLEERLYLFVKEPGVAPTNNAAERALRPAVIWRKKCFGSQSEWGERFVERVLTVRATCQQQHRSFLEYLRDSLRAEWFGLAYPNLCQATLSP